MDANTGLPHHRCALFSDVTPRPLSCYSPSVSDVSPARTGPVTVGVGHAADSTLRAGALVANRLACGMAVISVIEPGGNV